MSATIMTPFQIATSLKKHFPRRFLAELTKLGDLTGVWRLLDDTQSPTREDHGPNECLTTSPAPVSWKTLHKLCRTPQKCPHKWLSARETLVNSSVSWKDFVFARMRLTWTRNHLFFHRHPETSREVVEETLLILQESLFYSLPRIGRCRTKVDVLRSWSRSRGLIRPSAIGKINSPFSLGDITSFALSLFE